eukprot:CAMPEP_0197055176 /NCGR_PEP_ID=MMETSP1384-20130603/58711_1 /TAXON_ID=29189 /ORGANISM="Ammonia sp." /LENGTH=536 /DNA_ID=CAMNT_0042488655 /DNA_START=48 /DNA_END=1658 /DNA_ORIENTATION=-
MQYLSEFRDLASRGKYDLALESFKQFGEEIGEMEKDKKTCMIEGYSWKQIKNELQKEAHLVHEILNELSFFHDAQSFGPSQHDAYEDVDVFNMHNKPQKSIQERYEAHIGNKRALKPDRLKHNKRIIKRRCYPLRPRRNSEQAEDKRKNILSPHRKERRETHHVNPRPKRSSLSRKEKEQSHSALEEPNKYRPPSGIDFHLVESIENSMIQRNIGVKWDDIASLDDVKKTLKEVVILPTLIPEYFRGIRKPSRGILLFGPPGTGKTLLAKAVASSAKCTFFNVSPSLVVSKWRGDSSKMIRLLFEMARFYAPSVIFFDEIDAIATSRGSNNEHEASRQLKSELLIQMDGVNNFDDHDNENNDSNADEHDQDQADDDEEVDHEMDKEGKSSGRNNNKYVMVLATTNYPWLLDEALRRRLEKRIYIDLPDKVSRIALFQMYFKNLDLDENIDFDKLSELTAGYNGSDIEVICKNASMIPMRKKLENVDINDLEKLTYSDIETKITQSDIESMIQRIKSSVSESEVEKHKQWFLQFGSL